MPVDIEPDRPHPAGCAAVPGLKRFTIFTRTENGEWKRVIQHDSVAQGGRHVLPPGSGEQGRRAELVLRASTGDNPYSRRFVGLAEMIVRGSPAA